MTGAQAAVAMLRDYGVEAIFGVPGDTSLPLYQALSQAGGPPRHVLARDERSAAFMADAYARLSHKPGLCECPSGAGPLYALPGVAEANASSIPIILLTSDIPLAGHGKQTITELETESLFRTVTKWSCLVTGPDKVPESLRRAFRIAVSDRPGAVHLALPQEAMTGPVRLGECYAEPDCRAYPAFRTRGARDVLERLARLLVEAGRPVVVAGGGANHSQAGQALTALAEHLAMPVVTTISGQGIMADTHPLALGVIGDNGYHAHAHRAVEESDLLFYVGCKRGSVSTINWTMPRPDPNRKTAQLDINPRLLGNNEPNTLSVCGDARLVLEDLVVLVKEAAEVRSPSPWVEELNRERADFWSRAASFVSPAGRPLDPRAIISTLNRHLTGPSVVIADAGTPTPYTVRFLKLEAPGSRFLIPRAYGGLGYAIPALVGAHLARPEARLAALFGDGSLGMSAGELETLARLGIPAVLVHFNNGSFGWIKALQKLHGQGQYFSVDFTPGDPVLVARGFGLEARRVSNLEELDQGLAWAFSSAGPVFLDVPSLPETDQLPPVKTWELAAARDGGGESGWRS